MSRSISSVRHADVRFAPDKRFSGYLISRVQDTARRQHFFSTHAIKYLSITLINAVDGSHSEFNPSHYQDFYRGHWKHNVQVPFGKFAICLSHITAWQKIIDDKVDFAFIFEDDAFVSQTIIKSFAQWCGKFDLFFINHRLDTWTYGITGGRLSPAINPYDNMVKRIAKRIIGYPIDSSAHEERRNRQPIPVGAAVQNVLRRGFWPGRHVSAPGAEGYGLTRRGAVCLLNYAKNLGIVMDIDAFLVAAATCQADYKNLSHDSHPTFHFMYSIVKSTPVVAAGISGCPCVSELSKSLGGSVTRKM